MGENKKKRKIVWRTHGARPDRARPRAREFGSSVAVPVAGSPGKNVEAVRWDGRLRSEVQAMATRERFDYDDRTFYVEAFKEGAGWKGRFVMYGCVDMARQERKFEVGGTFKSEVDALGAAKRAVIDFAA